MAGRRLDEAQKLHPLVAQLDIDRNARQERYAVAVKRLRRLPGIARSASPESQGFHQSFSPRSRAMMPALM